LKTLHNGDDNGCKKQQQKQVYRPTQGASALGGHPGKERLGRIAQGMAESKPVIADAADGRPLIVVRAAGWANHFSFLLIAVLTVYIYYTTGRPFLQQK